MYPYRSKPLHQLIPIVLLLLSAIIAGFFPTWQVAAAFIVIAIICLVTGIWIAVAGVLEKYADYWENVGRDIDKLQKTPPELWGSIGFSVPPRSVTVRNITTGEEDKSSYYSEEIFEIGLSPQEMQVFANGILTGAKTLAEADWKNTQIGQTKARKAKHILLQHKYIQLKNPLNNLSGFDLNEKGFDYLYKYASDWALNSIRVKVVRSPDRPPSVHPSIPQSAP
jgi:hypothetical protein